MGSPTAHPTLPRHAGERNARPSRSDASTSAPPRPIVNTIGTTSSTGIASASSQASPTHHEASAVIESHVPRGSARRAATSIAR